MFLESRNKHRLIRITVVVAVLGLLLSVAASLLTALAAEAHASLESISPADRSTVTVAPTEVRLRFTEDVSASFATVTVTGAGDVEAGTGRATVDGAVLTQALKPDLGSGAYAVAYRVVSEDGHPITGTASFTLAVAPAAQVTPSSGATTPEVSTAPEPTITLSPQSTPTLVDGQSGAAVPSGSLPVLLAGGALVLAALVLALLLARRRSH